MRVDPHGSLTVSPSGESPSRRRSQSWDWCRGCVGGQRPGPAQRVQPARDGTPGKNDASHLMAYSPQHIEVTIDSSRIAAAVLRCWWFNSRDGTPQALPSTTSEKSSDFSPPSGRQN